MSACILRFVQPLVFALCIGGVGSGLAADTRRDPQAPPPGGLPAFPSARGFGSATPGGRGGALVEVTSLADAGPGSLREALSREGPRIVLFRVGGTIELAGPIVVQAPYLTLAGQTAPGEGVCLKGAGLDIRTHDVVIRHLRVRPGAPHPAIVISGGSNIVLDHVSASWGGGSTLRIGSGEAGAAHDVTVQWSCLTETLRSGPHADVPLSQGLLVQEGVRNITVHHNLFAHNDDGNPRLREATRVDFVSNVVFDWGLLAAGVELPGVVEANLVENYFRRGQESIGAFFLPARIPEQGTASRIWIAGNRGNDDNLYRFNSEPAPFFAAFPFLSAAPPYPPSVEADDADWAFELVLGRSGAVFPVRDGVDERIMTDARRRTGGLIADPEEVGGWPAYRGGPPAADGDRDGMPDAWERDRGLDPRDPADAAADADGDGYANLEEYLNGLAGDP